LIDGEAGHVRRAEHDGRARACKASSPAVNHSGRGYPRWGCGKLPAVSGLGGAICG